MKERVKGVRGVADKKVGAGRREEEGSLGGERKGEAGGGLELSE